MALKLTATTGVRASILKNPLRFALLPSPDRAHSIEGQAETDAHQPAAKLRAFAQPPEPPIRAEQRVLRDVFRLCIVPRNAPRDAISKRRAFSKERFPCTLVDAAGTARLFASFGGVRFSSDRRQNPLLLEFSAASHTRSALLVYPRVCKYIL